MQATSIKRIAETLLNRRNTLTSGQVEADLKKNLSFDELKEAQSRGWVVASIEDGTLAVSNLPKHLDQIRESAASTESGAPLMESVKASPGNSIRGLFETETPKYTRYSMREDYKVGDPVVVAQDGESYAGTIAEKTPAGEYKISFGEKKPKLEKQYKADELGAQAPADASKPAPSPAPAPAPTMPAVAGI